jgi:hypothetical protein
MGSKARQGAHKVSATVGVASLNTLMVAPMVGSVVLMLVAVGAAAAAIGALSAFAGHGRPGAARKAR